MIGCGNQNISKEELLERAANYTMWEEITDSYGNVAKAENLIGQEVLVSGYPVKVTTEYCELYPAPNVLNSLVVLKLYLPKDVLSKFDKEEKVYAVGIIEPVSIDSINTNGSSYDRTIFNITNTYVVDEDKI